jgi:hypothetical protein
MSEKDNKFKDFNWKTLTEEESIEFYKTRINKTLNSLIKISNKTSNLNILIDCFNISNAMYDKIDKYRIEEMNKILEYNLKHHGNIYGYEIDND